VPSLERQKKIDSQCSRLKLRESPTSTAAVVEIWRAISGAEFAAAYGREKKSDAERLG
jgi:hypothetical protein